MDPKRVQERVKPVEAPTCCELYASVQASSSRGLPNPAPPTQLYSSLQASSSGGLPNPAPPTQSPPIKQQRQ
eukprot:1138309-Pelagomonas_calceolata.AAC.2